MRAGLSRGGDGWRDERCKREESVRLGPANFLALSFLTDLQWDGLRDARRKAASVATRFCECTRMPFGPVEQTWTHAMYAQLFIFSIHGARL